MDIIQYIGLKLLSAFIIYFMIISLLHLRISPFPALIPSHCWYVLSSFCKKLKPFKFSWPSSFSKLFSSTFYKSKLAINGFLNSLLDSDHPQILSPRCPLGIMPVSHPKVKHPHLYPQHTTTEKMMSGTSGLLSPHFSFIRPLSSETNIWLRAQLSPFFRSTWTTSKWLR